MLRTSCWLCEAPEALTIGTDSRDPCATIQAIFGKGLPPVTLPAAEVPGFYARVCEMGNVATALCLRFLILTGVRSNEARGARWEEIDLHAEGGPVWVIPAERMKAGREHVVPLCAEAVEILKAADDLSGDSPLVFSSPRSGKALSTPALLKTVERAGGDCTVHGFRSSFRQWASEAGEDDVQAELFLAHSVEVSAVEESYRRGARDMVAARGLAQRWASLVAGRGGNRQRAASRGCPFCCALGGRRRFGFAGGCRSTPPTMRCTLAK